MNELHQVVSIIALTMGVAWASGINLYAAILVLGLLGASGHMVLPPGLEIVTHPLVLVAAGFMYLVEFFVDKIPGVDTSWDVFHTFIRIPAAAALAAAAVGEMHPAISLAAALVGGGLATGAHLTKAGTRVLINTSPEPFSNWTASVSEDIAVVGGLWTALYYPWVFLILLIVFIAAMFWVLPKIWRGIRSVLDALQRLFRGKSDGPPQLPPGGSARVVGKDPPA
ncbi:protein of unknown function [Geoalkalibacter ferrihydriticus]|uniref:Membrane protein n=2 Tax=Geoalkalibacter ferrihydriticus TaxID=392333 RepID=A0A0C2HRD3_9BACT|nr:DUF4126 domain-containing protein [Geoalkalibacter ferrihydriticus]KIH77425.1 membrane protein [Geoalkalibacter ferrihydriticus DSM 17813]SDM15481.1 protein of unknown function [Geoalkalibacter ferrihydriticus]